MNISEVTAYSPTLREEMAALMRHLSDTAQCSEASLRRTLASRDCHLFVATDEGGHIVGSATLCLFCSPLGWKGSIEDVVVSPLCRGQHLGRALMEHILDFCRAKQTEEGEGAPLTLQLTSRASRTAARALYASLGFTVKDTGFFTLKVIGNR